MDNSKFHLLVCKNGDTFPLEREGETLHIKSINEKARVSSSLRQTLSKWRFSATSPGENSLPRGRREERRDKHKVRVAGRSAWNIWAWNLRTKSGAPP